MNMHSLQHHRYLHKALAVAYDGCVAAASFILAVWLRLGNDQFADSMVYLAPGCLLFTLISILTFAAMRLYRNLWRYSSLRDLMLLMRAVTLAVVLFSALMFFVNKLDGVPRSVPVINWLLLLALMGAPRFLYRGMMDQLLYWQPQRSMIAKIPVMLIGANDSAELFLRESHRNNISPYRVVALVDDSPQRIGLRMHGVPIYGNTHNLPGILRKLARKDIQPHKLILADDHLVGEEIKRLLAVCEQLGLPLARLPSVSGLKNHFTDKPDIRPIAIEDLLMRPQNLRDATAMRALVEGRVVMVTGAGGTIGSELTRQLAGYAPAELILIENSEYLLYLIDRELRDQFPQLALKMRLCDVRNREHIHGLINAYRPQLVFHAAAIKHVPIAEENMLETIRTNVFGSKNVAEACVSAGVEAMVMISTDKAVNPTNVMGASKKLAESYCQSLGTETKGGTRFITVRFGNVLGSTGSVVPLFEQQLARGGPLTVTHPNMLRYFMTVREAVQLVLQAATLGMADATRHAFIFVLDMGEPVKIVDLARQMIRLAGLLPEQDIQIVFTGLRPGEKLYEELFLEAENAVKTDHDGIFLALPTLAPLAFLQQQLLLLQQFCEQQNTVEALAMLKQMVPEFTRQDREH